MNMHVKAKRRWPCALTVMAVGVASASCTSKSPQSLPVQSAGPPVTVAALGGPETIGAGSPLGPISAWPQVLYREHLARAAVLVNFGSDGSVGSYQRLSGDVLELRPTLVVAWYPRVRTSGTDPVLDRDRDRFVSVVRGLRRGGKATVVVAVPGASWATLGARERARLADEGALLVSLTDDTSPEQIAADIAAALPKALLG